MNTSYRRTIVAIALTAVVAQAAWAAPTFFVSSNEVLLRVNPDSSVDSFTMAEPMTGLAFDGSGTLWATSQTSFDLFQVANPFGTPSLVQESTLAARTPSIEWVNGVLYGVESIGTPTTDSKLITIDPGTGVGTPVGATGIIGTDLTGGMTVDTSTNTMYGLNFVTETLFTIDWQLANGPDPAGTTVGPFGGGLATSTTGLDYYDGDGIVYATVKNLVAPETYEIGVYTVNTATGALTLLQDLSGETAVRGSSAIAVIPEPATGLLLAVAGIALLRRR